jgi:two-component system cell cycle sensor histidine kinase/response regulator CckA
LTTSALDAAGHRTQAVASGAAALALLEREPPPDLLVTDVVMPGLRGTELAARMRAARPGLRVLYLSGYSEVEIGDWRSGEKGVHFLAKPLRPSELADAVAALLAA